jgi:hypothetical protein
VKVREPEHITDYTSGGDAPRVTTDGPERPMPADVGNGRTRFRDRHHEHDTVDTRLAKAEEAVQVLAEQLTELRVRPPINGPERAHLAAAGYAEKLDRTRVEMSARLGRLEQQVRSFTQNGES